MGDTDDCCCALSLTPSCASWARGVASSRRAPALAAESASAAPAAPRIALRVAVECGRLAPVLCTSSARSVEVCPSRCRSVCWALGARATRVYAARGTTHEGPLGSSWGASEAPPPTRPTAAC